MAVVTSLGFSLYSSWDGKGARSAADALDRVATKGRDTDNALAAMAAGSVSVAAIIGKSSAAIGLSLVGIAATAVATGATVGAALGLLPLIFGAIGVTAVILSNNVNAAFKDMAIHVARGFSATVKPLEPMLRNLAAQMIATFDRMQPTFFKLFDAIAPAIGRFAANILKFLELFVIGLGNVSIAATPLLDVLGSGLVTVMEGVVGFFQKLVAVAPQAAEALTALFDVTKGILLVCGDLLAALTVLSSHALPFLRDVFMMLGAVIQLLVIPFFMALIPLFDALATSGLGAALIQIVAALSPVLTILTTLLVDIIVAALPLIVAVLTGFAVVLTSLVVPALGLLSRLLGGIRQAITDSISWVLQYKAVVVTLAVVIGTLLLPGMILWIAKWITLGVTAAVAGVKLVATYTMVIARTIVWNAISVGAFAIQIAGWIKTAAVATASAIRIAAAWLIALGPIGIIIAVVAAVVVAFLVFRDKVVGVVKGVWNWFKNLGTGIKVAIMIALAPITLIVGAIMLLVKHWDSVKRAGAAAWDAIKTAASAVWNFLKAAFAPVMTALRAGWQALSTAAIAAWNRIRAAVAPLVAAIRSAFTSIKTAVANAFSAIGRALAPVINAMRPFFTWLGAQLTKLRPVFSSIGSGIALVFQKIWSVAKPILSVLVQVIKGVVVVAFKVLATVVKTVFTIVVTAIKVAVTIIVAIIKVLVAIIKTIITVISAVVRVIIAGVKFWVNAFRTAFQAIGTAVSWFKTNIIDRIVSFVRSVVAFIVARWNAGLAFWRKVFAAIGTVVSWFKTNIIDRIVSFVRMVVANIVARWNAGLAFWRKVFSAIGTLVSWFKTNVIDRIANVVRTVVDFVKARWTAMRQAITIVFNAVRSAYNTFKTNVIDAIVSVMRTAINKIKGFWNGLKEAGTTVFNALKSTIEWFRDKFIAVKDKLGSLVDNIKNKWEDLKDTAESVWNKIKGFVKKPIKFLIETVYNNGIVKFWNFISDKLFGGDNQLDPVGLKGWAEGGPVRGEGTWKSDSIPARLTKGEHVWTPREVRAAGGHGKVMQMRSAVLRGRPVSAGPDSGRMAFAGGGFVDWIKDHTKVKTLGGTADLTDTPELTSKFVENVAKHLKELGEMPGKLTGWVKGLGGKFGEKIKPFKDMMMAGVNKVKDKFIEHVESLISTGTMSGGPGNYEAMGKWIKEAVPGTIITSGLRSGTGSSYHNVGKAIDMAFTDGSERRGGGKAKDAFNAIKNTWMGAILELIWDFSPDGPARGVKNGKAHTFTGSSAGLGTHDDHIHWASKGAGEGGGGGFFGEYPPGSDVGRWRGIASRVLSDLGIYSRGAVDAVLECIRQESSGNPNLQNNWDINAKNGIPSKGLMQVIPPTYNTYKPEGRSGGIWDPYNNIYAAVRYARDRYKGSWMDAITAPGGYSLGGAVKPLSYDKGGLLPPGVSVVHNGTGKPEPVGHNLVGNGTTIIINIDGSVLSTERQLEDVVVKAVTKARSKGRM